MSVIDGTASLSPSGGYYNPNITVGLRSYGAFIGWPPAAPKDIGTASAVPVSHVVAQSHPRQISGAYSQSYRDDYYDHIFVEPAYIDAGSITGDVSKSFIITNMYLGQTVHMTGYTATGDTGISLIGSFVQDMRPLQTLARSVKITTKGPAQVSAEFDFTFTGLPSPSLSIVGSRAQLWTLQTNWAQTYSQTFRYMTEILTSETGEEQRFGLRNEPRMDVQFSGYADNDALRDLRSKLSYWRDGAWMLPDETRNVTSTSLIGTGVDHVDVDSVPDWIHPGANLMFVNGPVRDVRQVESINGNTVTFTTEMARAWPADSIIRPAMTSYLGKDIKVTRLNADAANVAVNHEVVERNPDNVPDATKIMAGREILEVQPNYAAGLDDSHPMA